MYNKIMSKDDDLKIIIEHFDDKFAVLLENIEEVVDKKVKPLKSDVEIIKDDTKTIKKVVTATNSQLQDHENRLTILEQTV